MNSDDSQKPNEEVLKFFSDLKKITREGKEAAAAGYEALPRLVAATQSGGSQAGIVLRWLASIYNSSEAPRVQLDEIRSLDWTLQKDLVAVVIGCCREGFSDCDIRKAFEAVEGKAGAERLHWVTTGGPQMAALKRLVKRFVADPRRERELGELLAALTDSSRKVSIASLAYHDSDVRDDYMTVLAGVLGYQQSKLESADVADVLEQNRIVEKIPAVK